MNEDIENVIKDNPSERGIKTAAKKQKLLSLVQDGIVKVLNGTTTLDELKRVVDIEKE
jgi:type II secretory ATPase GspE/PulE/Tfp pilus assembly ATPase PilB-like protein